MFRNSFKFLTLALAASITVAPISAIDWNSGSTRVGLGIAVFGLVCFAAYKYWFNNKNAPKKNKLNTKVDGEDALLDSIRNNGSTLPVKTGGTDQKGNVNHQGEDDSENDKTGKMTPQRLQRMGAVNLMNQPAQTEGEKDKATNRWEKTQDLIKQRKTNNNKSKNTDGKISPELLENLTMVKFDNTNKNQ